MSFSSDKVGRELFNLISASWKSVGSVTFCSESRLGTLKDGMLMSPKGLTLFMAETAP